MSIKMMTEEINRQLSALDLSPLNEEQLRCLDDASRIGEAAAMLEDLRDRCGVRLPLVWGEDVGGPFMDLDEAEERASEIAADHLVLVLDELATDDSRSYSGNEYYLNAFTMPEAAVALAERSRWEVIWINGRRQADE